MKKIFIAVFLLVVSINLHAGTETEKFTIKTIATGWQASDIYVWPDSGSIVEGCGGNVYRMSSEHAMKNEIMSMLLSAYHANSPIKIYVDGCLSGSMKIQAVKLER